MAPCPECGDEIRFISHGDTPEKEAWLDWHVPWTCDGCGAYGTSDDLKGDKTETATESPALDGVVDLMAKLEQSVAQAKADRKRSAP